MRFFSLVAAPLVATLVAATALPKPKIWQSPFAGQIVAPPLDVPVTPGVDFAFEYAPSEWCEPAFEPFTVYLTAGDAPPPFSDVTADGALADARVVHPFGTFVVSHFGERGVRTPRCSGSVLFLFEC